jgi:hypothetical protein
MMFLRDTGMSLHLKMKSVMCAVTNHTYIFGRIVPDTSARGVVKNGRIKDETKLGFGSVFLCSLIQRHWVPPLPRSQKTVGRSRG